MNVTHDLIAAVQGPGWKYGLSRILINDEGQGVVFIAGSQEPFASFEATSVSTSRGVGMTADGEVTWRRRGSSCQYKLAKCKVSTETMSSWWSSSLITTEMGPEVPAGDLPQGTTVKTNQGGDLAVTQAQAENPGAQIIAVTKTETETETPGLDDLL